MTTVTQILDKARSYLGTVQWDNQHKAIVDKYNSIVPLPVGYQVKYTDDWCDTFITTLAIETGAVDIIGRECGVQRHIDIFKQKGIWLEDGRITPKPGDIITFNWDQNYQNNDGFADHIGIVEKVSGGVITTIEGNTDRACKRRTYNVGNGYIRGYARPKYAISSIENGWEQSNGKWYYYADGVLCKDGWRYINDKWYYFLSDGAMHIGWSMIDGKWYYFNTDGAMSEGWIKSADKWYYMQASGVMAQGWYQDKSNNWYYLSSPDGVMVTGIKSINNKRYEFNDNGICLNP